MLSIGTIQSIDYYQNLASADSYYQSGLEPPGWWMGQGATALRLTGLVADGALRSLMEGYAPNGQGQVQNAGKSNRQPGWDLTLSCDKTVSVVWAQADMATRQQIEAAHAEAVQAALAYLEDVAGWTRRGKGGQHWERAALVGVAYEHGSSRAGDAQLHTHLVIFNLCIRTDGTLGSIASKPFFRHKMTAGALYRAELASQLRNRLGLEVERVGPTFRLCGVPASLCEAFSHRRAQIKRAIKARGIVSAAGAAAATLATRTAKLQLTRDELRTRWQETGRRHSFTEHEVNKLIGRARPGLVPPDPTPLFQDAVARLMANESWFKERHLLRAVAEMAPGTGLNVRALRAGMETYLATNPEIVRVREDCYTTRTMLRIEETLLQDAERLHQANTPGLATDLVTRAMQKVEAQASKKQGKAVTLNPEQRAALEHITSSNGNLQIVNGMAGTGKTFLLSAAREAWEAGGHVVIGAALAGKAAQGLQEGTGIESMTLTRLLMDLDRSWVDTVGHHLWQVTRAARGRSTWGPPEAVKLTKNTVLVIDECGMVGSKVLAAVIKAVEKAGAKLVLIGDQAQVQAIEAGGPFAALLKRFGGAKLTDIVRQKQAWERETVKQFAQGQAATALQEYAKRGLFQVAASRTEAAQRLIADWKEHALPHPQDCLILTGSRHDRDMLNRQAQEARRAAGKVGWLPFAINGTRFYLGDRVMCTQNSKLYGVQNGQLGTLLSVDPIHNVARIRLDDASGKAGKCVSLPLGKYKALELGYAITTHKGQGVTVERAFVLSGGPMVDQELTYVQMSRAREETRLYADAASAGPEGSDLVRAMETSRRKTIAVDAPSEQVAGVRATPKRKQPKPAPIPSVQTPRPPMPVSVSAPIPVPAKQASTIPTITTLNIHAATTTQTTVLPTPTAASAPVSTPTVKEAAPSEAPPTPRPIVPTIRPR